MTKSEFGVSHQPVSVSDWMWHDLKVQSCVCVLVCSKGLLHGEKCPAVAWDGVETRAGSADTDA